MKSVLAVLLVVSCAIAVVAADQPIVTKPTDDKLIVFPGLPECSKGAAVKGDPMNGAAVIYLKGTAGCNIPMHWHTATEDLTIISGSGTLKMKDAKDATVSSGMYVHLPAKHPHALKCASACTLYIFTDGAFDIHYVDAAGKEIPVEQALGPAKKPAAKKK